MRLRGVVGAWPCYGEVVFSGVWIGNGSEWVREICESGGRYKRKVEEIL